MTSSVKIKIKNILIFTALAILSVGVMLQVLQFYRTLSMLKAIDSRNVMMFKIYPRTSGPIGTPIEFDNPAPIIHDFFQAIQDIKSYRSTPGSIISDKNLWFVEITVQDEIIQMHFCISSYTPGIVIGGIEHPGNGRFQSRKMLEWYQKYSYLWLNPAESTRPQESPH